MAVTFLEKRGKQKYLMIILGVLFIAIFFVIQSNLFSKKDVNITSSGVKAVEEPQIEIDFDVLKKPIFEILQPFEVIRPLKATTTTVKVGRDNPFKPYD